MAKRTTNREEPVREKYSDAREDSGAREAYVRASLALSMIPSVGGGRIRKLFEHFPEPMSVFTKKWAEISSVSTIGATVARSIRNFRKWDEVDRLLMMTRKHRMALVTPLDDCYPFRLHHIYDPPAVLWVKGEPEALKNEFLAVVGTRRPSEAGREVTIKLTFELIDNMQAGVVSGLAHGIDALAHNAALKRSRCTVAVLGCGLDRVYPTGNRQLAYSIMNNGGALISEYPPGTKPDAHHFPVRNRIVSGMSLGVIVTETGIKGGSMITADLALEQGREVFAVPHDIRNEKGEGCNLIIQRGWGKLVINADDIAAELPPGVRVAKPKEQPGNGADTTHSRTFDKAGNRRLDPKEHKIIQLLSKQTLHIDALSRKLKSAVHTLLPVLLKLELDGLVVQRPGKKFALSEW